MKIGDIRSKRSDSQLHFNSQVFHQKLIEFAKYLA